MLTVQMVLDYLKGRLQNFTRFQCPDSIKVFPDDQSVSVCADASWVCCVCPARAGSSGRAEPTGSSAQQIQQGVEHSSQSSRTKALANQIWAFLLS